METHPDNQPGVEILREVYAAINRNDIPAVLQLCDPEIERVEPPGFPSSGTYRGHAELEPMFTQARNTWAEGSCDPERFLVAGDKFVVFVHVRVRLKNSEDWIDARFADGFILRNGKVLFWTTFPERQQALDWAGIEAT